MQTIQVHDARSLGALPVHPKPVDQGWRVESRLRRCRVELHCPVLSLKTVLSGKEQYAFENRTIQLGSGQCLLVRASTRYEARVDTRFDTVGQCFFFSEQQARHLTPWVELLQDRLHQIVFNMSELDIPVDNNGVAYTSSELAVHLAKQCRQLMLTLERVDRVDPLSKLRVTRGLERARQAIENDYAEAWTVPELAALAHLSRSSFTRSFVRAYGVSPKRMLDEVRLRRAAERIEQSQDSLTRIGLDSGYVDLPTFSRAFRRHFGVAPSKWNSVPKHAEESGVNH